MKDVDDVGPHTKCQNTIVLTIHDDDDDDTKCVCVLCVQPSKIPPPPPPFTLIHTLSCQI